MFSEMYSIHRCSALETSESQPQCSAWRVLNTFTFLSTAHSPWSLPKCTSFRLWDGNPGKGLLAYQWQKCTTNFCWLHRIREVISLLSFSFVFKITSSSPEKKSSAKILYTKTIRIIKYPEKYNTEEQNHSVNTLFPCFVLIYLIFP